VLALTVLGITLVAASFALFVARDIIIRRVTSKSLGSLAPGFAATRTGFGLYVGLIGDIGVVALSLPTGNVYLVLASIALFVFGSVLVIAGEVVVYRRLKR
jgi:hypothetical protein